MIQGAIADARGRSTGFDNGRVRVLCVAGDPADAERARRALGSRFVVESAATGPECLARLTRERQDVVLLGAPAGDAGAVEVLRGLRTRTVDLPVVLWLAEPDDGLVSAALGLGVYDYVIGRADALARLPLVLEHAAATHRSAGARAGFALLARLLAEIAAAPEPAAALRRVVEAAAELLGSEPVLLLLREGGDWLVPRAWTGFPARAITGARFPVQAGVWARLLAAPGVTRLDPVALAEPWSAAPVLPGLGRALGVPIVAQGRGLGLLVAASPPRAVGQAEEAALCAIADAAATAVEQLRIGEELLHAERLSTVGRMVAGVAHELNNPLAVIVGTVDLLRHEGVPDRDADRVDRIAAQAQRAVKLVRTLLALARKRPPEPVPVDLNEVLTETLELAAYDLKRAEVAIVERRAPELPAVSGDREQLQQVFTNLVLNACHAIAGTGRRGRLTVTTRADGGRVVVGIGDDGPGVPAEHRDRIFEPFFTTRPEGTGLGLAICRRIVENHGGRIAVRTEPGAGAEFVVELPAAAAARPGAAPSEPDAALRPARTRVLLVEDEALVADMLEDLLVMEGHDVDRAANGREALARVRARAYGLVVTDVRMPDLGGAAFYRELAGVDPALARRVVFVTGDLVSPDTRRFLEETGLRYVEKPFAVADFQSAIRRALAT